MKTHSMLKKTRYTQRYMKLLPSRNWLPVSHSGQNVMKPITERKVSAWVNLPPVVMDCRAGWGRRLWRREARPTSVQLSSRDDDHQDVGARVFLRDVVAHQHSKRGDDEHCQELQAHYALAVPRDNVSILFRPRLEQRGENSSPVVPSVRVWTCAREKRTVSAPAHLLSARAYTIHSCAKGLVAAAACEPQMRSSWPR